MKPATQTTRDSRIDLRVNSAQKALLESAAASQGKSLSDFVIGASTEAAQLALADQNRFTMPEAQMTSFIAQLEAEPRDIPELRALFARKSVFE